MPNAFLGIPLAILLALEVYHLARRNGWRFSLTFFATALVFGIVRANAVGFVCWAEGAAPPYAMPQGALKLGFASLAEPFGWAFALYGSWFLAEGILRRTRRWEGGIFPVVFIATLLMGGFSYAVEAAATPMGWWHWQIANVGSPFLYAVPAIGVMDWASVAIDFLLSFFVLECTRWRTSKWRFAVLLIFAAHMLTHVFAVRVLGMGQVFDLWHWGSASVVAAAALYWRVPFEAARRRENPVRLWGAGRGDRLDLMPLGAVAVMLGIIVYAVVVASGDLRLLWSVAPLAMALLMAATPVPVWICAAGAAVACLWSLYAVAVLLPAGLVWLYSRKFMHAQGPLARTATAIITAAGFLAYVPLGLSTTERYGRLGAELRAADAAAERGDYHEAVVRQEAGFALITKYAMGDALLFEMLRTSRAALDKESFDFAARELAQTSPRWSAAADLWNIQTDQEFEVELKKMRKK